MLEKIQRVYFIFKFLNIEDFESLCANKPLRYVPEVVSRSKRPGSAAQNIILNTIGPPETSIGKNEKKTSQATKAGKATVATVDHDTEADLNLGKIPSIYAKLIVYLLNLTFPLFRFIRITTKIIRNKRAY